MNYINHLINYFDRYKNKIIYINQDTITVVLNKVEVSKRKIVINDTITFYYNDFEFDVGNKLILYYDHIEYEITPYQVY